MSASEMRMAVEAAGKKSISPMIFLYTHCPLTYKESEGHSPLCAVRYYLSLHLRLGRFLAQQPSASDNRGPLQWTNPHHWLRQLCGQPDPLRVTLQWVYVLVTHIFVPQPCIHYEELWRFLLFTTDTFKTLDKDGSGEIKLGFMEVRAQMW